MNPPDLPPSGKEKPAPEVKPPEGSARQPDSGLEPIVARRFSGAVAAEFPQETRVPAEAEFAILDHRAAEVEIPLRNSRDAVPVSRDDMRTWDLSCGPTRIRVRSGMGSAFARRSAESRSQGVRDSLVLVAR